MSTVLANRYRLLNIIGKGGMAEVYLALDEVLNREVAIKILKGELSGDNNAIERFRREAMSVTKLVHPNIVEVYDVGEDDNKYFIVMEYVKGLTLKKLISRRGSIDHNEAVFLMKQLVSAVGMAHKVGIIHRDIKPQNIIIKDDGTLKILDFGIALAHDALQLTNTSSIMGSVHYLAPELSRGHSASICSDIYAMGVVFYEILTGELPYKGENPIDVALLHVKKPFPRIKSINNEIPQSVENIITKCTAKNPRNRYQNATELNADLLVCFNKEHANDKRLIISKPKNKNKAKNKKKGFDLSAFFVGLFSVLLVAIAAVLVFIFLYLSGIINQNNNFSTMPNVKGMTVLQAQEVLKDKGLSIDINNIKRVLTDDVEKGIIISFEPKEGEEIEKGKKVSVVVSDGVYAIMDDYVGMDLDKARRIIEDKYLYVSVMEIADTSSDKKPGTILKQEELEPNMKFNPNVASNVKFIYAPYLQIKMLDKDTLRNKKVEEVVKYFEDQGFKVKKQAISDDSGEFEVSGNSVYYQGNPVYKGHAIDSDPKPTLLFEQKDNNYITIYYYE